MRTIADVMNAALSAAFLAALLLLASVPTSSAQTAAAVPIPRGLAANLILPPARSTVWSTTPGAVTLTEVSVAVDIVEQVATTTLDLQLTNTTGARLEAELILPVPDTAALRGFTFHGPASEPTAELLTRDSARLLYDSIVARTRDPALLEFVGCHLIRSSVFPLEPRGGQKIRLVYEHVLPADGDRIDYLLPRTESIDYRVPWRFAVRIASKTPIGTVYSPSHRLETVRQDDRHVTVRLASDAVTDPGPFRLSYLLRRQGLSASLLAYPEAGTDGGYFLLLACPPRAAAPGADGAAPAAIQKREVILVLDRSGSMAGPKLEQARAAALQVVEALDEGEAFNVVIYSDTVETFAPQPVLKSAATMNRVRAFLAGVRVNGGTNLHDALAEALRAAPTPGFLPLVLFLTDGLPTVGRTSERAIRDLATQANPHRRRVFTFGVGADVNTPLLDRLALDTRATSTFVLPGESVEVRVSQVFQRLAGPVLAEPRLLATTTAGEPAPGRLQDLLPGRLPDLFDGDQLVVLGRYLRSEPLDFELTGSQGATNRTFRLHFELNHATTANAFVPRLWASRKIAVLTDAIRDLGADRPPSLAYASPSLNARILSSALPTPGPNPADRDPRARELVAEIVRLSQEFGILTEYTAFLAREGTDLSQPTQVFAEAYRNFGERAMDIRSGNGSLNQSLNNLSQRGQLALNLRNGYLDPNLDRVQIATVQQVNDRAFYRRNGRWIDSELVNQPDTPPRRVVEIGSEEFRRLAARLAALNRQGTVSLGGEVLLRVDGETILVK